MTKEEFVHLIHDSSKEIDKLELLKCGKIPIVMWGAGSLAYSVYKMLKKNGVNLSAVLVDNVDSGVGLLFRDVPIISPQEMISNYEKVNIVMGHSRYDLSEVVKKRYKNVNKVFYFCNICYEQYDKIEYQEIVDNVEKYLYAYNALEDELSRKCLLAYLNSRMNDDIEYVYDCMEGDNSYFSNDLFCCDVNESFLDLGAYTGDTIEEFLAFSNGKYNEIVAFEPEEDSFALLEEYVTKKDLKNVELYKLGCYNKKARLFFDEKEESSGITTKESNSFIDVVDLDSCLKNRKITMVKLNYLYGVRETLEGMKKLLEKNIPKVAIVVGFDKFTVVDVIYFFKDYLNLDKDSYKMILRFNDAMPSRLVFYACKR